MKSTIVELLAQVLVYGWSTKKFSQLKALLVIDKNYLSDNLKTIYAHSDTVYSIIQWTIPSNKIT